MSLKYVVLQVWFLYLLGRHNRMTVGYYRYKCDDDGYFRLQRAREIKQSQPRATLSLHGSSSYNLRRVSGRQFEISLRG
jgi:hypothetical protein